MKHPVFAFAVVLWFASLAAAEPPADKGFVSIFDGKSLNGWHASAKTGHSGKSGHKSGGRWVLQDGAIVGSQDIPGNGGIFLTDQQFGDFEVALEMNNDFGPDSGLFLRSTETGKCYQAMIDYHGGGNLMGIYGEGLGGKPHVRNFSFLGRPDQIKEVTECDGKPVPTPLPVGAEQWPKVWKHGQWNELRARIVGNPPHITTWINGVKFMDWTETVKRHPDQGSIGVQVHGGGDFTKQFVRYRNIRVKRLDGPKAERRLPLAVYRDKMRGGWLGQMAGVGWGAPTEFRSMGKIIPTDKMPPWNPAWINQHGNDDLYVEMTFLKSLEDHGLDVSIRQAGIDFANSGYQLWHANAAGRKNLVSGIAPPDSGHPKFNGHADDIDYQIEADYSGLIAPGMPNVAIALGEVFGRLMNYGDGLYGGQFVGGMYCEAFFESDPRKIVEAGLRCIPEDCQYAECIRDVIKWHAQEPNDWQKTWQMVEDKYQNNPAYRRASCGKRKNPFNIDAKINGAYIVMGLLYGNRDPDQTITISCRCGQDSDCNPSNAAGVLFTTLGAAKVPPRFTEKLRMDAKFSYSTYTLPKVHEVCEKIMRQILVRHGGRIEKDAAGEEVLVIPVKTPRLSKVEQCWEAGPAAGSRFTPEEMSKIKPPTAAKNNL